MNRPLSREARAVLGGIEQCIKTIRYPVDEAGMFHLQVQRVLFDGGYNVTMETLMSEGRRVDLVVVHKGHVIALELERDAIPERTVAKFRDLPAEVLKVAVLRQWPYRPPPVNFADRVVCLTSSLRMVQWLVDGTAILEEATMDSTHQPSRPFHTQVVLERAHEAAEARRLILGKRKPAKRAS